MKMTQFVCAIALGMVAVSPVKASEEIIKKARCSVNPSDAECATPREVE